MNHDELSSDLTLIADPNARKHEGWWEFERMMSGRAYGREALNAAWEWFKAGYDVGWVCAGGVLE